jgi:transcriptional regulator with XRE-family HTH domain
MVDSIGKRLAYLRQKHGWTQQSLAYRLAVSRVAISHMEMDLTLPSERTVTLMAGVFKMSPIELVEGTSYPQAKAERLPVSTMTYSELELNYALLLNDTQWIDRLEDPKIKKINTCEVVNKWLPLLEQWGNKTTDEQETKILLKMRILLKGLKDGLNSYRE